MGSSVCSTNRLMSPKRWISQRGLISGGADKQVHFWGPNRLLLGQHQGEIRCLALHHQWLAAAGQDGQIAIYPWPHNPVIY